MTAELATPYAVAKKKQPNSAPRFLRYIDRQPEWTDDSAQADRMTHDEAERLADDWNAQAATKGFARRAYAHQIEAQPDAPRTVRIDMTWKNAAQIIAAALENGTAQGRDAARAELFRMADLLDELKTAQQADPAEGSE